MEANRMNELEITGNEYDGAAESFLQCVSMRTLYTYGMNGDLNSDLSTVVRALDRETCFGHKQDEGVQWK